MPTVNIELEKAVDNLIECREKMIQEAVKAERERILKGYTLCMATQPSNVHVILLDMLSGKR